MLIGALPALRHLQSASMLRQPPALRANVQILSGRRLSPGGAQLCAGGSLTSTCRRGPQPLRTAPRWHRWISGRAATDDQAGPEPPQLTEQEGSLGSPAAAAAAGLVQEGDPAPAPWEWQAGEDPKVREMEDKLLAEVRTTRSEQAALESSLQSH